MGQKVHPKGLRIGIIRDWDAKWFAEKDFSDLLIEDIKVREYIKKKLFLEDLQLLVDTSLKVVILAVKRDQLQELQDNDF